MRNLNKKGQIGATLTWVVAFVVIFFITLLFMGLSAMMAMGKKPASVSEESFGSKSKSLTAEYLEPSGYDVGDLDLQRELETFLNKEVTLGGQKIRMKYIISGLGGGVSESKTKLSNDEMKNNANLSIIYEGATSYFDNLYKECYVFCLNFTGGSEQVMIGKDCSPRMEDIYQRARLKYTCLVSDSNVNGIFNYASFDISGKSNTIHIGLLKGGISSR